jgi:hypothetical protein
MADVLTASHSHSKWKNRLKISIRMIFIADAHRDHGKRFVVRADEKLTAFAELESQLAVKGMDF